ncbi:MAG: MiaB/RimO family radical SAM methylthiotransferase [Bacteroidetes bacterium]|nr:MAG: MiaB/RimO family radical SAM methylthiotransferase [Bacteroidota bacterium]
MPYVRGREVHRPVNDILDNVKRLYEEGVREISLLGQNVNSYIDGDIDFPKLLALIAEKSNMPRIGFLTSHPKDFSEALADVIASHENIMPMVHLPFQAGSNSVLKRMNRKYTREDYIKKIEIAKKIPDVVLTTDIMVGFPGESEEDFEQTLDIVKRVAFHEAYMYRYNQRPGTRAESFNDQVPEEIKLERLDRLIKIQNEITANLLNKEVGKTHLCLFENISKRNKKELIGRTHNGLRVVVEAEATQTGKIYRVKINGLAGNTLKAAVVNRT